MIFISAGHHPAAPGAKYDRFIEHDEAVIWADMLAHKINSTYVAIEKRTLPEPKAMLVPTGVLKTKVDFINRRIMNGDIAIEVHFNSALDADGNNVGRGSETLYYPESKQGKILAQLCQNVLGEIFPPDRGVKEGWYRMDKSRGADFFLAKTDCPSIIIEPEFVHRSNLILNLREDAVNGLAEVLCNGLE